MGHVTSYAKPFVTPYLNMLYVEVMYHFNEQVDFKISSKFRPYLKGY